jgi:hypothetical protein
MRSDFMRRPSQLSGKARLSDFCARPHCSSSRRNVVEKTEFANALMDRACRLRRLGLFQRLHQDAQYVCTAAFVDQRLQGGLPA